MLQERTALEREASLLLADGPAFEAFDHETEKGLLQKAKVLALLEHKIDKAGSVVDLKPAEMDPGFYDGTSAYKSTATLQTCLEAVLKQAKYRDVKAAALADLTRDPRKPEFAGVRHTSQLFIASVSKVAAMLAAFQLLKDLKVAANNLKPKDKDDLFSQVRDGWIAAQAKGKAGTHTKGIALDGRRVIVGGGTVALSSPSMPLLGAIFEVKTVGGTLDIQFRSTGETLASRTTLAKSYNKAAGGVSWAKKKRNQAQDAVAKAGGADAAQVTKLRADLDKAERTLKGTQAAFAAETRKIAALGFRERLGMAVGGDVPVSNYATYTVVGDLGYGYMASVLLQTGLFDPARGGGLWLGARYGGAAWRGAFGGGPAQSGTAASLVAFMALMAQDRLVDPVSSQAMRDMMVKVPALKEPGTGSWLHQGLSKAGLGGAALNETLLLGKVGLAAKAADEIGYVVRDFTVPAAAGVPARTVQLRYAVAILRSASASSIEELVVDMDKCVLQNNGLTPAQGGHA